MILPPPRSTLFPYTTLFRSDWGCIPLQNSQLDASGRFSVAELNLKKIMEAKNPEENIQIFPQDRKSTRLNSSHANLVCRLLLEKKKKKKKKIQTKYKKNNKK